MEIRLPAGVKSEAIQNALDRANEDYDGNIQFKRCDYSRTMKNGSEVWQVTLKPVSSRGSGAKVNPRNGRRVSAVCWHGHGSFLEGLPRGTIVLTAGGLTVDGSGKRKIAIGKDPIYVDYNVGSPFYPLMASYCCECE